MARGGQGRSNRVWMAHCVWVKRLPAPESSWGRKARRWRGNGTLRDCWLGINSDPFGRLPALGLQEMLSL